MAKTYDFATQLELGKKQEDVLDEYFSTWYNIKKATLEEERSDKFDRWFQRKEGDPKWLMVEYKADDKADSTGNLFIETMSNVEMGRYGWAWLTVADIVVYYVLPDTLYFLPSGAKIREWLMTWHKHGGPSKRKVQNKGYKSEGYIVPTEHIVELIGKDKVRILP